MSLVARLSGRRFLREVSGRIGGASELSEPFGSVKRPGCLALFRPFTRDSDTGRGPSVERGGSQVVGSAAAYDYHLPATLIADQPITWSKLHPSKEELQRKNSRLLCIDTSTPTACASAAVNGGTERTLARAGGEKETKTTKGEEEERVVEFLRECEFGDVKSFLPEGSLLVANNTKVVHARLEMRKARTGGSVEVLAVSPSNHCSSTSIAGGDMDDREGEEKEERENDGKLVNMVDALSALSDEPNTEGLGEGRSSSKNIWKCMIKGKNVKEGTKLTAEREGVVLQALVRDRDSVNGQFARLHFKWWKKKNDIGEIKEKEKEKQKETEVASDHFEMTFGEVLQLFGSIPLPPYMKRKAVDRDEDSYQTVYSSVPGSVAAPTAGLHFTDDLVENLITERAIQFEKVTLHTGPGTFVPLQSEDVGEHHMHTERFSISKETLQSLCSHMSSSSSPSKIKSKHVGRTATNVVAVGTTTVRSLETAYWLGLLLLNDPSSKLRLTLGQWEPYDIVRDVYKNDWNRLPSPSACFEALLEHSRKHGMEELTGTTSIMIMPGYQCQVVNQLITNFHAPKTTLMLLVASFAGSPSTLGDINSGKDSIDLGRQKVLTAYKQAVKHKFRFLSYGDACFFARFSDLPPSFMDVTSPLHH